MRVIIVGAHAEAKQLINRISAGWEISVIDMEAYALAKVSYLYKIPFISFKYITDNLNSTGVSDWEQHVKHGANQFTELLTKI